MIAKNDKTDFPMEAVRYLAYKPCRCQRSSCDVVHNIHWSTCIVGKAQAFLERKVTIRKM